MSRPRMRIALGSLLPVGAILCVALSVGRTQQQSSGPPVETLLPAGAVIYVGWDGSEAHQDAWKATAAYESIYETGLADVMKKVLVFILNQAGTSERELMPVLEHITQRGLSLAVSIPEIGPPLPQAVVVVHDGKSLEPSLDLLIRRAAAGDVELNTRTVGSREVTSMLVPGSPGVEFGWWTEGEHLVLAGGIGVVESTVAVAEGRAANITSNPLWNTHRSSQSGFEVSLVSWIDFAAVRTKFGEFPIPHPDPAVSALTVGRVLESLGLENLGPFVYRSGYKDRALWSEATLDAPAPRSGLLALWDQDPLRLEELPPLPIDTAGFYASSVDWSALHAQVVEVLQNVAVLGPPQASAQLQAIFEQVGRTIGIDLRRELFDPLGDVICLYGDQSQGLFGFGAVLAAKVDDAPTLRRTVSKLLLRLAAEAGPSFIVRSVPKHGRELTVLQFADVPFTPSLVVDDEWLVVGLTTGLTTQSVESFLLRLDGRLPRWRATEEYTAAFAELPQQFTTVTVSDPRETMKDLLGFAPMMLTLAQFGMNQASRFGQPSPGFPVAAEELPPTELVTAPLFPNVSMSTVDAGGVRWQSRTSVPPIPLSTSLGGGSGVAVSATLVALLLPAVQQARSAARRTQSKNNLKQIGLALHNYHDVHKSFPQGTHPNDDLEVDQRLSWLADILPFIDQAPLFDRLDFEQAWDAEDNKTLTDTRILIYLNPNQPEDSQQARTHYVGLAGLGKEGPTLPATDKRAGVFAYNRTTSMRDIRDGTSNTIAVSEANKDLGPWAAGGKSTIRPLTQKPYINGPDGIGSSSPGGCNMLFCDGRVQFISENIDPGVLEALSTITGGETVPDF